MNMWVGDVRSCWLADTDAQCGLHVPPTLEVLRKRLRLVSLVGVNRPVTNPEAQGRTAPREHAFYDYRRPHMTTRYGSILGDRLTLLMIALAMFTVAILAGGCSEQGSASQADANAPVTIDLSEGSLTVRNRAGLPLTDVTLGVVVYGGTEFARFFSRIESSEQRQVMLSDLTSRDGTRFNRTMMRPKSIRLRARDMTGKSYEVERPWD